MTCAIISIISSYASCNSDGAIIIRMIVVRQFLGTSALGAVTGAALAATRDVSAEQAGRRNPVSSNSHFDAEHAHHVAPALRLSGRGLARG